MVEKKQMTEEEIKLNYITPAITTITTAWPKTSIRMEFSVTLGRIIIGGKKARRDKKGIADYLLFHNDSGTWFPVAVVEAKDNTHSPLGCLGQARKYAAAMDMPFAFSSNGDCFAMYDRLTGKETDVSSYIPLDKFPSPEELWHRYRAESGFSDAAEELLSVPYFYRAGTHEPRYYQWIAINRVLEAVANGKNRMLIVNCHRNGKNACSFSNYLALAGSKEN